MKEYFIVGWEGVGVGAFPGPTLDWTHHSRLELSADHAVLQPSILI